MPIYSIRRSNTPLPVDLGTNTILVMASSTKTCSVLSEFLASMNHDAPKGAKGRSMMLQRLRLYLWWKRKLSKRKEEGKSHFALPNTTGNAKAGYEKTYGDGENISEALKRKDKERAQRAGSRRRVRGGAPENSGSRDETIVKMEAPDSAMTLIQDEADSFAQFWASQGGQGLSEVIDLTDETTILNFDSLALESEFDMHYGLLPPEQTVLVRAYSDDTDDRMLAEIKPKFIVMYEPNMEFIRRIEVYKSSNPGMAVRVYHMVYSNSCEEHKYLAGIRKEKESFEKVIKERGSMLLPIMDERREGAGKSDAFIKTISSRIAGGQRTLSKGPSQVIVDMREFRSTLPSLLHASNLLVIPATLTVGDYILTPEICVERKSLSDLRSSLNNGRLYTQCELMSVHYKTPVLLIEFEEDKAFSLDIASDMKSYVKPTGKYPPKKKGPGSEQDFPTLQSKLVLLTLSFPRVRIIWSSSPYATTEIFSDLKRNNPEPDPAKAVSVGADDDPEAGAGINAAAEELLRCLPGITAKNVKHVMSNIKTVRNLCEMDMPQVQELLGIEPGKKCYEFMHHGESTKQPRTV
ncbi:hypothetical protein BDZ94DRAFT_1327152 [Collybia nuda]|uniref:ERCC4 domain-containing protein n=1 Tax=Collybia nuda TaxID=64659 RepID=A0A9P5XSQ9_9AGAR|nr:hypothetical protein BDZ94DRAFT_1327152 [Collybia nuda]